MTGVKRAALKLPPIVTRDLKLTVICQWCGKGHELLVSDRDVRRWQSGMLIQDAMPYLDNADRELLISHTCNSCWLDMFVLPGADDEE